MKNNLTASGWIPASNLTITQSAESKAPPNTKGLTYTLEPEEILEQIPSRYVLKVLCALLRLAHSMNIVCLFFFLILRYKEIIKA